MSFYQVKRALEKNVQRALFRESSFFRALFSPRSTFCLKISFYQVKRALEKKMLKELFFSRELIFSEPFFTKEHISVKDVILPSRFTIEPNGSTL